MTEKKHRKFDVIIGNPPFQEETAQKESKNGQKTRTNIFQKFQESADKIADITDLIYPGKRWLHRSGKGLKKFGEKQINDPHLDKITYYPNATQVFSNIGITDGVTIVIKNIKHHNTDFLFERIDGSKITKRRIKHPGKKLIILRPDLIKIAEKIENVCYNHNFSFLSSSVYPRSLFNIDSDFVEKHDDEVEKYNNQALQDNQVKLYTNEKSGSAGRATWFVVNKNIITKNTDLIDKYKVIVSSAHPGGQANRDNQLAIIDNKSVFGRSRIALKMFNDEHDAKNFYHYMQSRFIKFTLLLSGEALSSFAKWTPDILDYSNDSIIDFSKNIDKQLYDLFDFDTEEIKLIEEIVKESGTKGSDIDE